MSLSAVMGKQIVRKRPHFLYSPNSNPPPRALRPHAQVARSLAACTAPNPPFCLRFTVCFSLPPFAHCSPPASFSLLPTAFCFPFARKFCHSPLKAGGGFDVTAKSSPRRIRRARAPVGGRHTFWHSLARSSQKVQAYGFLCASHYPYSRC